MHFWKDRKRKSVGADMLEERRPWTSHGAPAQAQVSEPTERQGRVSPGASPVFTRPVFPSIPLLCGSHCVRASGINRERKPSKPSAVVKSKFWWRQRRQTIVILPTEKELLSAQEGGQREVGAARLGRWGRSQGREKATLGQSLGGDEC